ncbi:MAG: discoidin domain-containing protein [Ignavibacteriales bacterium]|nr:discoidin domain-containing protein [Ignavibacteriales bacterium]MCB9258628.1 discoidin domain-containing protein [Ignavibacteriales bacterium]
MTAIIYNRILQIVSFLIIFNSIVFSGSSYKMSIEEVEVINNNKVEACVYIENVGEEVQLTSYQCALSINQNIDLSSLNFSYVQGSSELLNEPDLYVGIDNIDGPTELTFVSYIGHDIISKKTLVGKFSLKGNVDVNNIDLLAIQWDFEGTISTIITGDNFVNITNPQSHVSVFGTPQDQLKIAKVNIVGSEASAVHNEKFTDKNLYDGITASSNGGNYNSSSDGRWAVAGFPQWITIDLGEDTYVDHIMINGYGSDQGISYDCEFYSGRYSEKSLIKKETTSTGTQWSEHSLGGITTRYLTIVVTGSEGNDWCDIWEVEVYGNNSTTGVGEQKDEEEVLAEEETIPTEYGISQNYPNPFNPSTKVEVKMKDNAVARLEVYNLIGEKVLAVLDEELSAGIHEINIDGSRLASGVYIYQLIVDNKFSQVKKMNLIK